MNIFYLLHGEVLNVAEVRGDAGHEGEEAPVLGKVGHADRQEGDRGQDGLDRRNGGLAVSPLGLVVHDVITFFLQILKVHEFSEL